MEELQSINLLSMHETPEETQYDFNPKTFDEYLGQEELKKKLAIYTQAAKMRNESLDHLLLFGPPGLGKTTLSQIMAEIMGVHIKICSGPMMERTGDLVAILSSLEPRDILFIDEIHRMPIAVEEVLYSAMEHFRVDVIVGQGAGAKSINLPINPFTLIGATTKSGAISAPLRSRFGISERLDFYTDEELRDIVLQCAAFLECDIEPESALLIGKRARGTPRIAKKILRRVRDVAQVTNDNVAHPDLVQKALTFLGIDEEGLTKVDHMILKNIVTNFNGGPVGLETIASMVGEDKDTIELVYEPFLMRKGYIEKTPRGRQVPHTKLPILKQKFMGQSTFFKSILMLFIFLCTPILATDDVKNATIAQNSTRPIESLKTLCITVANRHNALPITVKLPIMLGGTKDLYASAIYKAFSRYQITQYADKEATPDIFIVFYNKNKDEFFIYDKTQNNFLPSDDTHKLEFHSSHARSYTMPFICSKTGRTKVKE